MESEKEKDNLLVLEAIRFLGDRGVLNADEGNGDHGDGGGDERDTPDVKQGNIDNDNIPENRDGEGLPGGFDKGDGREENRVTKEDEVDHPMGNGEKGEGQEANHVKEEDEVDHPMEDVRGGNGGDFITVKHEGDKPGIKEHRNEDDKQTNTAPKESNKEHVDVGVDNQHVSVINDGTRAS